jgi:hypothetical protein
MTLQPFVGPSPLLQFPDLFYTDGRTPWASDQSVEKRLPTHRTTQTQITHTHTDTHATRGIRTHDPSVRASEDSSASDRAAGYYHRRKSQVLRTESLKDNTTAKVPESLHYAYIP